jgi:hypothetical protein
MSELADTVARSRTNQIYENKFMDRGDPRRNWSIYGSDHKKYADYFGLPQDYFLKLKEEKPDCIILDLMSDTSFIASLDARGVAIGLTCDPSHNNDKQAELAGEIITERKKLLAELDRLLADKFGKPGFDLIVFRPADGYQGLSRNPDVPLFLLKELWKRLGENGQMVLDIPGPTQYPLYNEDLIGFWNKSPGITANNPQQFSLIITKQPGAPKELPLPEKFNLDLIKLYRSKLTMPKTRQ